MRQPEKHKKRGRREKERERERETEQESYMQLELFQVYHNLVMSYLLLSGGARSMHVLDFNTKDACVLMGNATKQPS